MESFANLLFFAISLPGILPVPDLPVPRYAGKGKTVRGYRCRRRLGIGSIPELSFLDT